MLMNFIQKSSRYNFFEGKKSLELTVSLIFKQALKSIKTSEDFFYTKYFKNKAPKPLCLTYQKDVFLSRCSLLFLLNQALFFALELPSLFL